MKSSVFFSLRAFTLGAGVMYYFDPRYGHRRRVLVKDKLLSLLRRQRHYGSKALRDMAHRAQGTLVESKWLVLSGDASDPILHDRVRTKLGRAVSQPHAIQVIACQGCVTLRGQVLANEMEELLGAVKRVHGVHRVVNELQVHQTPQNIPALQGGTPPVPERFDLAQENWAPATRCLVGGAGSMLIFSGIRRGGFFGTLAGAAGIFLLTRATTNMDARRLVGVGVGARTVDVRKTLTIGAPVEEVFEFWRHFANFSKFMSHVKEVRDLGGGRSHWKVAGPAGIPVEFTADITDLAPNELLAWKTEPGSAVKHAGLIRFERIGTGACRVDIRMSYDPIAGALGHAIASFFNVDPRHAMNDDLVRLKSMLERGKASAPGKHATREDVMPGETVHPSLQI